MNSEGRSGGSPLHCGGEPGFNWREPLVGTRNYMGWGNRKKVTMTGPSSLT